MPRALHGLGRVAQLVEQGMRFSHAIEDRVGFRDIRPHRLGGLVEARLRPSGLLSLPGLGP